MDRAALRRLTRADWIEALKLSAIGNLLYYLCLAGAIQRAGGALPTMIIGTLPVVIAVTANLRNPRRDGRLPWLRLLPSLLLIAAGIGLRQSGRTAGAACRPRRRSDPLPARRALAVVAVVCWTWYPLRNADWLRAHPDRSPRTWATAQGVATLPLALLGYASLWIGMLASGSDFAMPFGPRPGILHCPDGGHRPVRVLAGHAVLERIQPAAADRDGRAS